jgi:hypothetical protein
MADVLVYDSDHRLLESYDFYRHYMDLFNATTSRNAPSETSGPSTVSIRETESPSARFTPYSPSRPTVPSCVQRNMMHAVIRSPLVLPGDQWPVSAHVIMNIIKTHLRTPSWPDLDSGFILVSQHGDGFLRMTSVRDIDRAPRNPHCELGKNFTWTGGVKTRLTWKVKEIISLVKNSARYRLDCPGCNLDYPDNRHFLLQVAADEMRFMLSLLRLDDDDIDELQGEGWPSGTKKLKEHAITRLEKACEKLLGL